MKRCERYGGFGKYLANQQIWSPYFMGEGKRR
jgi:hypothetical protein